MTDAVHLERVEMYGFAHGGEHPFDSRPMYAVRREFALSISSLLMYRRLHPYAMTDKAKPAQSIGF
jgi:hypothetical protein